MYRRTVVLVAFLLLPVVLVAAQETGSLLELYQTNFSGANQQTKLEILRAAESENGEDLGPFYGQALSYVVSNANRLYQEQELRQIGLIAIRKIADLQYSPAVTNLWRLFEVYQETSARIEMLRVLGPLAEGNQQIADFLTAWVSNQNGLRQAGEEVDLQTLTAAVTALGDIGVGSAVDVLLEVVLIQYPDFVTEAAEASIQSLVEDPLAQASSAITGRDTKGKLKAFEYFLRSDLVPVDQHPELARVALQNALTEVPQEVADRELNRQLRFRAAEVIRNASYGEATRAMIRHFNATVLEYDRRQVTKDRVLEAIAGLGAMGTDSAAERLNDYMDLLNTYTETDRPYDTQIVLATITNLERLSFPSSYNVLFYATLLENYPQRVKDAARQAMRVVRQ